MTLFAILLAAMAASIPAGAPGSGWTATFSIAAYDTETGEMGIAVASKVPFVGHDVPWAAAGIGAIATQAWVNQAYGPDGLSLLAAGYPADQVLDSLISADEESAQRQVGIVDAAGLAVTFTGAETMDWAGGLTGPGYAIQGNILTDSGVVIAMEEAYLDSYGPLAERLLVALRAGDEAGGDSRGKQSAAILVVRAGAGNGGASDRFVDLAVSDHPDPIPELIRLYRIWSEWNMLDVYLDAGREPESDYAVMFIERALEDSATYSDPQRLNQFAWVLAERGLHPDFALTLAAMAQSLAPDDPNIMDTLAQAYFSAGQPDMAVEWESKALDIDPENSFYQEQLSKFIGEY